MMASTVYAWKIRDVSHYEKKFVLLQAISAGIC